MASSARDGFSQVYERLRRAEEHLATFSADVEDFLIGPPQPYDFAVEYQAEGNDRFKIYNFVVRELPPLAISSLVSDILHNLRAALDNAIYALAVAHKGAPLNSKERRDCGFPIATSIEDFDTRKLRSVSPDVVTAVEGMQPYHRKDPDRHRLAVLHRLSNLDKHRALHLGFYKLGTVGFYSEHVELLTTGRAPLQNGAEAARFRLLHPGIDVDPVINIQITLNETGTEYIRGAEGFVESMIRYVRETVVDPLAVLFS